MKLGAIRVGVGGWSFAPWRNNFYPLGLSHNQELRFSSAKLSAIEINATFYRTQTPDTFRRWAEETPDGFVFSVKAHRMTTLRKRLVENGPAIEHFLASGVLELGDKMGPIVWQFAPTKKFDAPDFETFLKLLPKTSGGRGLRHVLEVRHESFCVPEFIALARRYECAICLTDSAKFPNIADITADFIYARLQNSATEEEAGYAPDELGRWRDRARSWAQGDAPEELRYVDTTRPEKRARDVFVFFIAGAKQKNPAAACALIERLTH